MDQDNLRYHISRLEGRIEELTNALERSRKIIRISQAFIAGGGLLATAMVVGVIDATAIAILAALSAILGGIVGLGSSVGTQRREKAELRASEAKRAELIGRLDLREVRPQLEARPTLH